MIEQRSLFEGDSVCLMDPVGIICVSGLDRLTWLHSLLSQNLKNLKPGESAEALLLDPQGHIEQLIKIIDDGESSWLMVNQENTEALLSWLSKMVFRMKVGLTDRSTDYALVGATKPKPELAFVSNSQPLVWKDGWPGVTTGGYRYSTREVKYSWFEHLVEASQLDKLLSQASLAGTMAADALRVAAGRPLAASEIDEKSLPHELDLLSTAVHLSKGCYRGQESVAKVHNLGHPPRRLTFLHLDGSEHSLPDVGDEVRVSGEDKVVGKVTSAAQHFEMGPIALAVISRSVAEDASLEVSSSGGLITATQEIIVPQSAGKVVEVPKLPRLKLGGASKAPKLGE
ncbi:MAG: folate-binding protein [Actinobacteria bacterium]|nr:folate-binding protein [Actinomycetota bacterium]MTA83493.1 folate-binding protein [Actinomycetota bacterium]